VFNEKLEFLNKDFFAAYRNRMKPGPEAGSLNEALHDDFVLKAP
jgi:hypothetical protein